MIAFSNAATLRNTPRRIRFSVISAKNRSDLIQPRPAGRCEMEVILGMPLEPPLHRGRLVRPVVVQDDVDLDTRLLRDLGSRSR